MKGSSTLPRIIQGTVFLLCVAVAGPGCSRDGGDEIDQTKTTDEATMVRVDSTEPVDVMKSFMISMMTSDQSGVEAEILPNVDAEILWQGGPSPERVRLQIKNQIDSLTLKEYTVGNTISLPGGREFTVTTQMVGPSNKLVVPVMNGQPMPTPFPMKKVNGEWKVDARFLIQSRIAAKKP